MSSKEHDWVMPGHQTNMPESRQNSTSSINQYWKATFMWWTWEEPDPWTGNGCFIFLLRLSHDSCSSYVLRKMPHSPCLAHKASPLQATLISISSLKTNPAAPKYFWSLTFRESVRNQLPTRESMRLWEHEVVKLWDSQQSRETWHVDLYYM